ncbi:MAG: glucoamylase family protein [Rudaea sp.]|uniref:GH36-type glycosyl hydrolase domain-containing protein n=1 Tax=Rudaea sp. TaxID=2136325 RepID=UPI0039E711D5
MILPAMKRLGLPLRPALAPRKESKRRVRARLSEAPLRAELLTSEQMAERGHELAGEHEWRRGRRGDTQLLERLRYNETLIDDTCRALAAASADKHRITPAGEWLLDNLYVIHEQVRKARAHLPRGYSAELPVLTRGASADMPRVYDLALDAISHGDGRVDQDALARFVRAYQERAPLSLGELWAIPIMLRAALIENLGRAAARVRRGLAHSRLAAHWARLMLETARRDPKSLILVVADMARAEPPLTQAFVAEMSRRLHGAGPALNLPLSWIEQRLAETGLSIAQLVQTSHHERALDRVTIDNSIASLRLLDALDWHEFVETTSAVDRVLAKDPAGVYARMDFATRDAYRHAVEHAARRGGLGELNVAQTALELARAAAEHAPTADPAPAAHVGHHLVGPGRGPLLRRCGAGVFAATLDVWRSGGLPFGVYVLVIVAVGLAAAVPALRPLWTSPLPLWLSALATFCGAVAISHPVVWLVDRLALALVGPRPLPRMDFRNGIPRDARTLVVVPCLFGSVEEARTLADQLELRYLANRDDGLVFALLSDFPDADEAELPRDAAILDAAAEAIQALNRRHPKARFVLLQRPRVWNDRERRWMGRERKRGKLADLNTLLRSGDAAAFSYISAAEGGRPMSLARAAGEGGAIGGADGGVRAACAALAGVRYVITLDVDTRLPSDAARRLVETMAHPLNRPRLRADGRSVESGYTILQPRVGNLLPPSGSTRYAALFGGDAGLDPYTQAVSDLYQDLFGEGSFIGKGIYDVDAFERVLGNAAADGPDPVGRFPDNRILSHDLLEGCYARAGLTADIELYEEYPQSYRVDAQRRARWIRGDWQIAAWLFPSVPMAAGRRERNPLSWLSRWKIFDNLRRSVLSPALFVLLLLAWFVLPQPLRWTALVLVAVLLPVAVDAAIASWGAPSGGIVRHLGGVLRGAGAAAARAAFRLVCLPYEAMQNASMIARTGWRVHVSKRHLLQWVASSVVAEHARGDSAAAAWRQFKTAPLAALAVAAALLLLRADLFALAAPWLAAWFFAPALIAWLARVPAHEADALDAQQTPFVRQAARRTWAWFEQFVGADDNWLPPDHFQEYPSVKIMHRTSSTNIGMGLLANLAAHDLGYVSLRALLAATRRTLDTLHKLERYRGHLYNWYDTETLRPLQPMYVSTVDSGNFVGHVLTLRQGLFECLAAPIVGAQAFAGLADTFAVLRALSARDAHDLWQPFAEALAAARRLPPALPIAPTRAALRELFLRAQALRAALADGEPLEREWSEKLLRQAAMCVADVEDFVGDVSIPAAVAHDAGAIHTESPMPNLTALAESKSISAAVGELARTCVQEIEALGALCADLARVEWNFLYDPAREQFAIGYNVSEGRRDAGYYDLLASEARLAVYLAVAQGQIPQDGWFALGRVQTQVDEGQVLLSWSGSMFEYLMPQLVMPAWPGSLLAESARVAVARQIAWGREHGLPWGISESGYFLTDAGQNYHYRAFGAPGLGLERGSTQNRVIAPYASALAILVAPNEAARNLAEIAAHGWWTQYGYYEAIDFTPAHLPEDERVGVVREYMAHHQGMSLVAFGECLNGAPMQRRFAADAELAAALLLLQERVPRDVPLAPAAPPALDARVEEEAAPTPQRRYIQADTPRPAVQLLSNGNYHLMLTQSGAGYSRWRGLDLTRWREDPTRDAWGTFVHIRDVDGGKVWSTCAAVAADRAEACEIVFDDARIEQRLTLDKLEARVQVVVSPEDDIELRRLRLTNRARGARVLELTSYAEVVLNAGAADALHPAFNNLFVQTEILRAHPAILATRRPRLASDMQPWLMHLFCVREESGRANAPAETSFETDRMRFLGRGNGAHAAAALRRAGALSNTAGDVLDPIVAIRQRVSVPAEGSVVIDLVTGAGGSREAVLALADKYRDRAFADRALAIATTHNRMALGQINVSESEAQLYSRLASAMLYADPARRASAEVVANNRLSQSGLWAHGISGDLPIALVLAEDVDTLALVRAAVAAQRYCATKGLRFDLVVLNEERGGYRQEVNDAIYSAVTAAGEGTAIDRPGGGVFIRSSAQIPHEDRVQLLAVARVVLSDRAGGFAEQLKEAKAAANEIAVPKFAATRRNTGTDARQVSIPKLAMFNGHGGFARDGREYVVVCDAARRTPLPWANVLANPQFGSVVTESGGGYTFFDNAHEYRLTPWSNDAVADASGEAFYLRDEETGAFWSSTPLPAGGRGRYLVRHGFGYTQFEHVEDGIASELRMHVDAEAAVKFFVLRLRNDSGRARRLSVTGYVEWVLGDLPARTAQHVTSWLDGSGALLARNTWNAEFADHIAFFDAEHAQRTVTCDRSEFIGRNGSLDSPAAMRRANLSGRVGAGLDPCAAIQVPLELADGEACEVIFRLGAARSAEEAEETVARLRRSGSARASFEGVAALWQRLLGNVVVTTPDPSLNLLANWLPYQTIACRLWARSGFHQSGGAFGFRDQLQDAMALVHADPTLLREQILLAAQRQFREGDVQHWWHPPGGRGVRTMCSDDYLWLPLAVARYVRATGDHGVLGERSHYLEARPLNAGEESYYDLPLRSNEMSDLYQHCVRAIEHALNDGIRDTAHGLPRIGSGDWNDGFSAVGIAGRGESVWLGFFLHHVLMEFRDVADLRGDDLFAARCERHARELQANLERHAWDGGWYRRAWFDDGTPLGSKDGVQCRIDSIAQSWTVLSGAGDPARTAAALDALDAQLVDEDARLVRLLDPPFDRSAVREPSPPNASVGGEGAGMPEPGYIAGYLPGVRENGGQYTHAAVWAAMAFAQGGRVERAWQLFDLINPLNHTVDEKSTEIYKGEPYVVAGDVYANPAHRGRAGWTWYTGSAGWMYRLLLETLLGLTREGARLRIAPRLPAAWPGADVAYRHGDATYAIHIARDATRPPGTVVLDGVAQADDSIVLDAAAGVHRVEVYLA